MDIREEIGDAACYEQLAEEAAELAHAALKVARILRGENPTPVELEEAKRDLIEEYSDVSLVGFTLDIEPNSKIFVTKRIRWIERIKEAKNEDR